jgi:hypothetical protein
MRDVGLTLALVLALVGCAAEPAAESGGDTSATTAAATGTTTAGATTTSGDSDGGDSGSSGDGGSGGSGGIGGGGEATLTIGDVVYTFDNYYCASGASETLNDDVPFSSGAFGEVEGVRVQLDASVYDPSGEGRMEGDGVVHSVTLDDIEDFENPSVSWHAESGFLGAAEFTIQYDGSTVFVEAMFNDDTTDEGEAVSGTLEATCGD